MKVALIVVGAVVLVLVVVVVGIRVVPQPFEAYPGDAGAVSRVPLPGALPDPVERFFRVLYGDEIPVYTSAVIDARAPMRIGGITLQTRIRFTHDAGRGYRHYIEATWYGLPVARINERYLDGEAVMELPFGIERGPRIDQAANLGLWAETVWLAAVWVTDPGAEWEAVDEQTALVRVPFGDGAQTLIVRFDPDTGLVSHMESMRFKGADSTEKTLWLNVAYEWAEVDGQLALAEAGLIWLDEGTPWAVFRLDSIVYNSDVSGYIRAKGL